MTFRYSLFFMFLSAIAISCNDSSDEISTTEGGIPIQISGLLIDEYSIMVKDEPASKERYFIQYNLAGQPLRIYNEFGVVIDNFEYEKRISSTNVTWTKYVPNAQNEEDKVYIRTYNLRLNEDGYLSRISFSDSNDQRKFSYDEDGRMIEMNDGIFRYDFVWNSIGSEIERINGFATENYQSTFGTDQINRINFEYSFINYKPVMGWGPGFFTLITGAVTPTFNGFDNYQWTHSMVNNGYTMGPVGFIGKLPRNFPYRATFVDPNQRLLPNTIVDADISPDFSSSQINASDYSREMFKYTAFEGLFLNEYIYTFDYYNPSGD